MILHTAGWFDDAKSYVERFVETFRPDSGANMLLGPVLGPIYNALIEGTASNPAAAPQLQADARKQIVAAYQAGQITLEQANAAVAALPQTRDFAEKLRDAGEGLANIAETALKVGLVGAGIWFAWPLLAELRAWIGVAASGSRTVRARRSGA